MKRINLVVVPIFSIFEGIRYDYILPDSNYGEWLVFENDLPKYYFNAFDEDYQFFSKELKYKNSISASLIYILDKNNNRLQLNRKIRGIRLNSKSIVKEFFIERLPKEMLLLKNNKMNEIEFGIEFRRDVLLSVQRALLGNIYPSIRAIAVGYEGEEKFKIIYYLDRQPNDEDFESISDVTGKVRGDINFSEVEKLCIFTSELVSKLDNLVSWVYIKKYPL
jgi:hypothetical protein